MIVLVANLIALLVLCLINPNYGISFEVAFVGTMGVVYSSYKAMKKKLEALQPPKHSSLGMHSNDLEDFGSSQTPSLVSLPKSSKNIESTTANIRMLGDSNKMEGVESYLDSRDSNMESKLDSKDSTKEISNSLESNNNIKSSTSQSLKGEKGVVTKGKAFAPTPPFTTSTSALHALKCASHDNIENSTNNLDSASLEDSNYLNSNLDSTLCVESSKINSVCGTHPLKASSGERESVREGEGSDFASACSCKVKHSKILSLSSPSLKNGRLDKDSLVGDSKELGDSSLESNKINLLTRTPPLKSVVGGGGKSINNSVREEKGSKLANSRPLPLSQKIERVEDSKVIEDSKGLQDSTLVSNIESSNSKLFNKSPLDSTNLDFRDSIESKQGVESKLVSKDSNIKSSLDSNTDSTTSIESKNNDTLESSPDSSDDLVDKLPLKERFSLGFRLSFGLLRILSYSFIALGVIALVNNKVFFIIPFLFGVAYSSIVIVIYIIKKDRARF